MKKVIKGERVVLRPHRLADVDYYLKWMKDPQVTRYLMNFNNKISRKDQEKWVRSMQRTKKEHSFAIETIEGKHIGSTSLKIKNKYHWNLGLLIGDKKVWNKGYGTEVVKLMLSYAFKHKTVERVSLDAFENNKAAIRVYKKCGFKIEGLRRKTKYRDGKFYNDILMSVIREDWFKNN